VRSLGVLSHALRGRSSRLSCCHRCGHWTALPRWSSLCRQLAGADSTRGTCISNYCGSSALDLHRRGVVPLIPIVHQLCVSARNANLFSFNMAQSLPCSSRDSTLDGVDAHPPSLAGRRSRRRCLAVPCVASARIPALRQFASCMPWFRRHDPTGQHLLARRRTADPRLLLPRPSAGPFFPSLTPPVVTTAPSLAGDRPADPIDGVCIAAESSGVGGSRAGALAPAGG